MGAASGSGDAVALLARLGDRVPLERDRALAQLQDAMKGACAVLSRWISCMAGPHNSPPDVQPTQRALGRSW